jgi:hypothetical protein
MKIGFLKNGRFKYILICFSNEIRLLISLTAVAFLLFWGWGKKRAYQM